MFAAKQSEFTPAQRARVRRTLWLLLVYAVILPPLIWIRSNTAVAGYIPLLMALVASLPVLGIFASWGRYLSDERDEYHQALTLRGCDCDQRDDGCGRRVGLPPGLRGHAPHRGLLDPVRLGRHPGCFRLPRPCLARQRSGLNIN